MNLTHYITAEHRERWTANCRSYVVLTVIPLVWIVMYVDARYECKIECSELIEIVQMFDGNAIIAV